MNLSRNHYIRLTLILVMAIALRFWHLGTKPLWLDEVIGALFTLGRGLGAVPLTTIFPLTELANIFAYQPGQSCAQITQAVATESVHPPLFFCLQYHWLGLWLPLLSTGISEPGTHVLASPHWIWVLRSLPALFGVLCVAGSYLLVRLMVSPIAGLMAAALMAVSPFAVYLSQEARHYTLPMFWTILALIGLVLMQRRILSDRTIPWPLLLGWTLVNSFGLYTHYFFLLDFTAQVMALGGWLVWRRLSASGSNTSKRFHQYASQLGLSVTVVIISYLPWIPTLLSHINRPETDWLKPYKPDWSDRIAPLYQTIMGWILMGMNLPVESQPLAIAIPAAITMLILSSWLGWHILQGLRHHWKNVALRPSLQLLYLLLTSLLIQVFAIVYILDKDITAIPRYNFISYPILLPLFAIGLFPHSPTPSLPRSPTPPLLTAFL
ncbi:MAG: glycosyltransferase family 39 protein, partial [Leptolyngbyaceae cyanobacterium]